MLLMSNKVVAVFTGEHDIRNNAVYGPACARVKTVYTSRQRIFFKDRYIFSVILKVNCIWSKIGHEGNMLTMKASSFQLVEFPKYTSENKSRRSLVIGRHNRPRYIFP